MGSINKKRLILFALSTASILLVLMVIFIVLLFIPVYFEYPPDNAAVIVEVKSKTILPTPLSAITGDGSHQIISYKDAVDAGYRFNRNEDALVYSPSLMIYLYHKYIVKKDTMLVWSNTHEALSFY